MKASTHANILRGTPDSDDIMPLTSPLTQVRGAKGAEPSADIKLLSETLLKMGMSWQNFAGHKPDEKKAKKGNVAKPPPLTIPKFDGTKKCPWQEWWPTYSTLIHDQDCYNEVEKFTYLKAALEGEAEKVISNIMMNAEGYVIAIDMLKEKYGDPQSLIRTILRDLKDMPPVENYQSVLDFCYKITSAVRQLENMGIATDNEVLRAQAEQKLSPFYVSLLHAVKAEMEYKHNQSHEVENLWEIVLSEGGKKERKPLTEMPWNMKNFLKALQLMLKKREAVIESSSNPTLLQTTSQQSFKPGFNKIPNYSKGTGGQQNQNYSKLPNFQKLSSFANRPEANTPNAPQQKPWQKQGAKYVPPPQRPGFSNIRLSVPNQKVDQWKKTGQVRRYDPSQQQNTN